MIYHSIETYGMKTNIMLVDDVIFFAISFLRIFQEIFQKNLLLLNLVDLVHMLEKLFVFFHLLKIHIIVEQEKQLNRKILLEI
jgi:hypothetical protein